MGKLSTKTKQSFQPIHRAASKGSSRFQKPSSPKGWSPQTSAFALLGALSGLLVPLQNHEAFAGTPYVFSYGGRLALPSGESVKGPVNIEIKFYRSAAGGSPLPVTPVLKSGVILTDGIFQVDLTELAAAEASLVFSPTFETWVEIADVTNKTVYPRQRLTAVPYAFKIPVDQTTVNFDGDGRLTVGTIDMAKVNGLEAALAQKSVAKAVSMTDVTGLDAALAAKANSNITVAGDVSGSLSTMSVNKLKGVSVSSPGTANTYLKYDGSGLVWSTVPAAGGSGDMLKANNLSDLANAGTARTNLGLGILATSSSVTSALISDGTIVDADINASAAIADTKLATISTAGKVSGAAITSGTIGGTTAINSSGSITTTGAVTATGAITGTGNIVVNGTGTIATELRFNDNDNTNYVGFKSPATVGTNKIWTLPAADGTVGQFLRTDGSGTLNWSSPAGSGDMLASANLSDLANAATARTNLGLGALATLGAVGSTHITDSSIINADVNASAAIATSKLSGAVTSITGHGLGSMATLSAVGSTEITDGSIVDADINASAAIAQSKISGLTTSLSGKEPTITAGTTSQFYRGDKTWQTFDSTARTAFSITPPLTYNSGTGVFGLGQSSVVADGYLSSSDFTVFNNKQAAITAASTLNTGTVTSALQNGVQIKPYSVAAGNTGELRFNELAAYGTNFVGFKAPDTLAGDKIWTLPAADGSTGQLLQTNGSGVLSWVSAGGGGNMMGSNNLSELTNASTARTNLGLGTLATSSAVTSAMITDDTIVNADINASAAIADTKLATISTAGKVSGSAITSGTIGGSTVVATSGQLSSTGNIRVSGTGISATELRFGDNDDSNYVGFKSPATVGTNRIWTLPAADGTNGQLLKTDGSGALSWVSAGGGGDLLASNNLSDLANAGTARTNLGLGALATNSAVTSALITNDTIVDADINSAAAIADTKLATISTAGKVSGAAITSGTIAGSTVFNTTGAITTSAAVTGQNIIVNATGAAATELRFNDNDNSNYVGFKSPGTVSTNKIWTLPSTDGTTGQVLKTDGSGILSWSPAVSASSVTTAEIVDSTISNADISSSAAIADTKLATITSAGKVNGTAITGNLAVGNITTSGNVGIGTGSPQAQLQVVGQMVASQSINPSVSTVDFNNGNAQVLQNPPGGSITLNNMIDGGAYTLVIQSSTSNTFTFPACTVAKFSPPNGPTVVSTDTIYSIQKFTISSQTVCYISWITGF